MDKTSNITFKILLFIFVATVLIFSLAGTAQATDVVDYEKYQGQKLDPSKFPAIEGEVSGQVAPGVSAVYVNGAKILTQKDNTFNTKVSLSEGQAYLNIETRYGNMRFIKKYLVIRTPEVKKPFKIHVAQKDFQTIAKKPPKPKIKLPVKKEPPAKAAPKENWAGFELVAEIEPGQLLAVERIADRYFAYMYIIADMVWVPVQEISYWEFRALLEKGVVPAAFMRGRPPQTVSSEAN